MDHRSTIFTDALLDALLSALRDPATGRPRLGEAQFDDAVFLGDAIFSGDALFGDAVFAGTASYEGTEFAGVARFRSVRFSGDTGFDRARFVGDAWFEGAVFEATPRFGALMCGQGLILSRAVFAAPVTIGATASSVVCLRTRWDSTATLRLRYADVDLTDAVLTAPVAVATHPIAFTDDRGNPVPEPDWAADDPVIRVLSLRGVDATHLAYVEMASRFTEPVLLALAAPAVRSRVKR